MRKRNYTEEEIAKMKENAEVAVISMTSAGIAIGFAPVFIDVAALMRLWG